MHTTMRNKLALVWALALVTAGCQGACDTIEPITGPGLTSGSADFSVYVAAGTSITAGTQSGGTVDRHQVHAFPTLFARQIGKTVRADGQGSFSFNPYNADGLPALSRILDYSPLVITNAGRVEGTAQNTGWAPMFQNLGVPFAIAFDFVDSSFYYAQSFRPPVANQHFTDIVRHRGSIAQGMLEQAPTFVTWEFGSNEVLGPTSVGLPAATNTGETFSALLAMSLSIIHGARPDAKIALLNIPDLTVTPLVSTLPPFTVSLSTLQPMPLLGVNGPLQPGDFVLLTAAATIATTGTGIPVGGLNYLNMGVPGNGQGLPENVILRAAEAAQTSTEVAEMNAAIAAEVAVRPYVALVDFHATLNDLAANGLRLGANVYTTDFVTGGLFSLDGVHPSDLGQAVICNALIAAVNSRFGSGVPALNLNEWATPNASRARPVRPDGQRLLPVRIDGLAESLPRPVPDGLLSRIP